MGHHMGDRGDPRPVPNFRIGQGSVARDPAAVKFWDRWVTLVTHPQLGRTQTVQGIHYMLTARGWIKV